MGFFDKFKSKKEQDLGTNPTAASASPSKATAKESAKKETVKAVKETTKKDVVAKKEKRSAKEPAVAKTSAVDTTDTLLEPLVTEKTADQATSGKYTFVIRKNASKTAVRTAVENTYGVHVTSVRVQNVSGKTVRFGRTLGRRNSWKKAIVTLKKGERLDIYEAMSV